MAKGTTVYLCRGKRCCDHPKRRKELIAELERVAEVQSCGCVRICQGPVAGLELDGEMEWFRGLHSKKSIERMAKLVAKGKMPKGLKKRRVKRRCGNKPPKPRR